MLTHACKLRCRGSKGLGDFAEEYETLLRSYPKAANRPAIYLEAIDANLLLAQ